MAPGGRVRSPSIDRVEEPTGANIPPGPKTADDGQVRPPRRPNLFSELGTEPPAHVRSFADEAGSNARTVVYLVRDEAVVAVAFVLWDVMSLSTITVAINARRLDGVDLSVPA